ncbi:MAG TPA: acetate kinase, partial [Ktedonobacterales bacterium]|nr:acetate kinase [Ktedonobacterales bacterium]
PQTLDALRSLIPLAPNHLPAEIATIEAVSAAWPTIPQVACFDIAFHATMPAVAQRFALPRRFYEGGVRRYGFHGISYASICDHLISQEGPTALAGRTIIAHLGSGASMVALLDGQSVDTTMGLTPFGGLVMSTRSGDLDPGVLIYLARQQSLAPDALETLVSEQSGMLGLSAVSGDMQELLAREQSDPRCAEALESFCYAARKTLGALTVALGGLDRLIFTGGIGEHAATIRERICDNLGFLGIELDADRNARHASIISPVGGPVTVRVIPTNEEAMIARYTAEALQL